MRRPLTIGHRSLFIQLPLNGCGQGVPCPYRNHFRRDDARVVHAYPTQAEAIKKAAEAEPNKGATFFVALPKERLAH